jgi:hypothetical protein
LSVSEIRVRQEGGRAGFSVGTAQASLQMSAVVGDAKQAKSAEVFHMLQSSATYETNVA